MTHEEDKPESEQPWSVTYYHLRYRCTNKNRNNYAKYGGRGIEARITRDEVKSLWFRDKAYSMNRPSIDRIDNDGHYSFENCRFIEQSENSRKTNKKDARFCVHGHEMTKENTRLYGKNKTYRQCRKCESAWNKKYHSKEYRRNRGR